MVEALEPHLLVPTYNLKSNARGLISLTHGGCMCIYHHCIMTASVVGHWPRFWKSWSLWISSWLHNPYPYEVVELNSWNIHIQHNQGNWPLSYNAERHTGPSSQPNHCSHCSSLMGLPYITAWLKTMPLWSIWSSTPQTQIWRVVSIKHQPCTMWPKLNASGTDFLGSCIVSRWCFDSIRNYD